MRKFTKQGRWYTAPSIVEHLCAPCAEHLAGVRAGLRASGVAWEEDPRLVRGLDYYSRTTFEFVGPDENAKKMGLNPRISGERSEDEGLFVCQHEHWVNVMRDALKKERGEVAA